jgi:hypothetical protein
MIRDSIQIYWYYFWWYHVVDCKFPILLVGGGAITISKNWEFEDKQVDLIDNKGSIVLLFSLTLFPLSDFMT